MNKVWLAFLIQTMAQAIKTLVGAVAWDATLKAVTDLLDANLTGEEKRRKVQADLQRAFADVPKRLLNLAIEIAVAKVTPG